MLHGKTHIVSLDLTMFRTNQETAYVYVSYHEVYTRYINTEIVTELLNYDNQMQNNVQQNHQEAGAMLWKSNQKTIFLSVFLYR